MHRQLLCDVESCTSKEQVAVVVQQRYGELENCAVEPKGRTVAKGMMEAYYDMVQEQEAPPSPPPKPNKKKRGRSPVTKQPRVKLIVDEAKPFLDRVLESIRLTSEMSAIERQLCRLFRSPDYVLLLRRAWCLQEMQHLSAEEQAQRLGSTAESAATSSMLKQPRTLHTLIVEHGLHLLRHWCPSKESLSELFHRAKCIEQYMRDHPQESQRWRADDAPQSPTLSWFVEPQLQ